MNEVIIVKRREVNIDDLLGREPVCLDVDGISSYLEGRLIVVTGGGGSIGSELCRQIASFNPQKLIILDNHENSLYDIQNELLHKYPKLSIEAIVANIRERDRICNIFEEYRPDVVFHAAAHKHVPLMEANPGEAVKNNVFGTLNVVECSDRFDIKKFVLVSTDKAVNPTSIMGASKRIAEMLVQAYNDNSDVRFSAVRFGNVLGSSGSVVPLFKKQIEWGGPVTVTHPDITRFFMTVTEAVQLVIQSGAMAEGGEIFALDMGKPIRIYDLACKLVRLSGFEPETDIKIVFTGLRPGEKLHEELLLDTEILYETSNNKIFIAQPVFRDLFELKSQMECLKQIDTKNSGEIRKCIETIVPMMHSAQYAIKK